MPLPRKTDPVERVPARELIADQLRAWIVQGQLEPGENLRDAEIAERLGVSRTPVREAVLQLEREGLIESRPQGWTRVAPLDYGEFEQIHTVWVELQALAARLAAEHSNRDVQIAETVQGALRDLVERAGDPFGLDRQFAIAEADDEFHAAIVLISGNDHLAKVLAPANVLVRRYQIAALPLVTPIGKESLDDHDRIISAVRGGDAAAAAMAMRRNTERALPASLRTRR